MRRARLPAGSWCSGNPLTGAAQTIADAIKGIQGGDPADLKRIADALSQTATPQVLPTAWFDKLVLHLVDDFGLDSTSAQLILSARPQTTSP